MIKRIALLLSVLLFLPVLVLIILALVPIAVVAILFGKYELEWTKRGG